jgi:hypothetical protein
MYFVMVRQDTLPHYFTYMLQSTYNASGVKIYNATGSLARFENKNIL